MDVFEKDNFYIDGYPRPIGIVVQESGYANLNEPGNLGTTNITLQDLVNGQNSSGNAPTGNSGTSTTSPSPSFDDLTSYLNNRPMTLLPTQPLDTSFDTIEKGHAPSQQNFLTGVMDGISKGFGLLTQQYGNPNVKNTAVGQPLKGGVASGLFTPTAAQSATGVLAPANGLAPKKDRTVTYLVLGGIALLVVSAILIASLSGKKSDAGTPVKPAKA